jgi:hypothetical protein
MALGKTDANIGQTLLHLLKSDVAGGNQIRSRLFCAAMAFRCASMEKP